MSAADCRKIDEIAEKANAKLKRNHDEALVFIRLARGSTPKKGPSAIPVEHKVRLDDFNARRDREIKQFIDDLRAELGGPLFEKLDDHLNADVISRIQTLTPKTGDLPAPPRPAQQ